jgi:hypothetical protein
LFQGIGKDLNVVLPEKVPDEFSEELGDDSVCESKVAPIFKNQKS